ncbi:MAG: DUF559 domain-containing protein [Sphingobium sp.]
MDKGYNRPTARARELRHNATDAERALWQVISARKISGVRFNRQVPIGPYIADFVARSIGLIIEVDGGQHNAEIDAARTRHLESKGFRVVRLWNNDVLGNLDGVIVQIERAIADTPSPDPSRTREGRLDHGRQWPCP